jgi:hypothetical protein
MGGPFTGSIRMTSDKGTLQMPPGDGRTMVLNGFGAKALYSDGAEQQIGGYGDIIPALGNPQLNLGLSQYQGTSTTATAQVTPQPVHVANGWSNPTGNVIFTINGQQYGAAQINIDSRQATLALPQSAFTNGPGVYTIGFVYTGDASYGQAVFDGGNSSIEFNYTGP